MINQLFPILKLVYASFFDWWNFFQAQILIFKDSIFNLSQLFIGVQPTEAMFGLVFGAQRSLNSSLYHSFKVMGMLHIWSASGFNVAIFVSTIKLILNTATHCSAYLKTILLLLGTCFFWMISGQGPSMQRAVIMSALSLLVRKLLFKQLHSLWSLVLTVVIILLLDFSLISSLSLQFSVAATAGIIVLNPLFFSLEKRIFKSGQKVGRTRGVWSLFKILICSAVRYFYQNFSIFFSVQLALLPLISSTWGEIGWLSVLTNTFLAGLLPLLVTLGIIWFGCCALASVAVQFFNITEITRILGLVLTFPLNIFLELSHFLARFEAGTLKISEFSQTATWLWFLGWGILGRYVQLRNTRQKTKPLAIKIFANAD